MRVLCHNLKKNVKQQGFARARTRHPWLVPRNEKCHQTPRFLPCSCSCSYSSLVTRHPLLVLRIEECHQTPRFLPCSCSCSCLYSHSSPVARSSKSAIRHPDFSRARARARARHSSSVARSSNRRVPPDARISPARGHAKHAGSEASQPLPPSASDYVLLEERVRVRQKPGTSTFGPRTLPPASLNRPERLDANRSRSIVPRLGG